MRHLFITLFLTLTINDPTLADYSLYSEQFTTCMEKTGGATFTMIDCINEEVAIQDARLNNAYDNLLTELTPERKKELREVQRIWIRYRDANCNFHADPEGGSIARISGNHCVLKETVLRAIELEQLFTR